MSKQKVTTTHVGRDCKFGSLCKVEGCYFNHTKRTECRFGDECRRNGCWYNHPEPKKQSGGTNKKQSGGDKEISHLCKYGKMCRSKKFCMFNHQGRLDCRDGDNCFSRTCEFNHATLMCIHRNCTLKSSGGCPYRHQKRSLNWDSDEETSDSEDESDEESSEVQRKGEPLKKEKEVKKADKLADEQKKLKEADGTPTSKEAEGVKKKPKTADGKRTCGATIDLPVCKMLLDQLFQDLGIDKSPSPPPSDDEPLDLSKKSQEIPRQRCDSSENESGNSRQLNSEVSRPKIRSMIVRRKNPLTSSVKSSFSSSSENESENTRKPIKSEVPRAKALPKTVTTRGNLETSAKGSYSSHKQNVKLQQSSPAAKELPVKSAKNGSGRRGPQKKQNDREIRKQPVPLMEIPQQGPLNSRHESSLLQNPPSLLGQYQHVPRHPITHAALHFPIPNPYGNYSSTHRRCD